jgi:hypothetical protein
LVFEEAPRSKTLRDLTPVKEKAAFLKFHDGGGGVGVLKHGLGQLAGELIDANGE